VHWESRKLEETAMWAAVGWALDLKEASSARLGDHHHSHGHG